MLSYVPSFMPQKVLVVGCGGTGSRLIPQIAQFIKTCGWVLTPEMVIVDDDVVEDKNLRRQNFISLDVGKSKAVVLAQRYSKAYDINIIPIIERIETEEKTVNRNDTEFHKKMQLWRGSQEPVMVIMCVDSAEARRSIVSRLQSYIEGNLVLLIDTGNENDFGQVNISMLAGCNVGGSRLEALRKLPKNIPGDIKVPIIPIDAKYYADMVSSDAPSCADLDQTMAINSLVATVTFSIIQNWYYAKPINFYRVGVTLSHGCIPQYMDSAYLCKMNDDYFKARETRLFQSLTYSDFSYVAAESIKQAATHKNEMDRMEAESKRAEKLAEETRKKAEALRLVAAITQSLFTEMGVKQDTPISPGILAAAPVPLTDVEKTAVEKIRQALMKDLIKKAPKVAGAAPVEMSF